MELLQIATAQFITKCDGLLLQIATAFLLQSATRFITNCDRYYKVRWIYYKLRQVLQSAMIITNCDSTDVSKDSPRTNEKKIAKSLARSLKQRFLPHLFKLKFCTLNQLICSAKLIHVFGNRCSECKKTITCSNVDFFVKIQIYFSQRKLLAVLFD